MKRIIVGLLFIVFIPVLSTYIFIPSKISVSKVVIVKCNPEAAKRIILNTAQWKRWWTYNSTGDASIQGEKFILKKDTFTINKFLYTSVDVFFTHGKADLNTTINVLPVSTDTTGIQWEADLQTSLNPFKRIQTYLTALALKKSISEIVTTLQAFLSKQENVYGFVISRSSTVDTTLVATKTILTVYPTTQQLYSTVKYLQNYIHQKGAKQTSYPMVNVTKLEPAGFQLMTAIPTDRVLPAYKNILYRRMVPGYFLVAQVKGGSYAIDSAINSCLLFINDHKKTSMAIPFQVLITDRSKEPDTLKWLTKVYYPVNF